MARFYRAASTASIILSSLLFFSCGSSPSSQSTPSVPNLGIAQDEISVRQAQLVNGINATQQQLTLLSTQYTSLLANVNRDQIALNSLSTTGADLQNNNLTQLSNAIDQAHNSNTSLYSLIDDISLLKDQIQYNQTKDYGAYGTLKLTDERLALIANNLIEATNKHKRANEKLARHRERILEVSSQHNDIEGNIQMGNERISAILNNWRSTFTSLQENLNQAQSEGNTEFLVQEILRGEQSLREVQAALAEARQILPEQDELDEQIIRVTEITNRIDDAKLSLAEANHTIAEALTNHTQIWNLLFKEHNKDSDRLKRIARLQEKLAGNTTQRDDVIGTISQARGADGAANRILARAQNNNTRVMQRVAVAERHRDERAAEVSMAEAALLIGDAALVLAQANNTRLNDQLGVLVAQQTILEIELSDATRDLEEARTSLTNAVENAANQIQIQRNTREERLNQAIIRFMQAETSFNQTRDRLNLARTGLTQANATLISTQLDKVPIAEAFARARDIYEEADSNLSMAIADNTLALASLRSAQDSQTQTAADLMTAETNSTLAETRLRAAQDSLSQADNALNSAQDNFMIERARLNSVEASANRSSAILSQAIDDNLTASMTLIDERNTLSQIRDNIPIEENNNRNIRRILLSAEADHNLTHPPLLSAQADFNRTRDILIPVLADYNLARNGIMIYQEILDRRGDTLQVAIDARILAQARLAAIQPQTLSAEESVRAAEAAQTNAERWLNRQLAIQTQIENRITRTDNRILSFVDDLVTGEQGANNLFDPEDVASAVIDNQTFVFVSSGDANALSSFSVETNGSLEFVDDIIDGEEGARGLSGVSHVTTAELNGETYIFTSSWSDESVSVFRLESNNTLAFIDSHQVAVAAEMSAFIMNDEVYLAVVSQTRDGAISVLGFAGSSIRTIDSIRGGFRGAYNIDSAYDVTTTIINNQLYAFVAAQGLNGVRGGISVFSISDTGLLTFVDDVIDGERGADNLRNSISVAVGSVDGNTYAFVSSVAESAISMFSVADNGTLTFLENISDTQLAVDNLGAALDLDTIEVDGFLYVFVTSAFEHAINAFTVSTDGRLLLIDDISDGERGANNLVGSESVSARTIGNRTYVFVTAAAFNRGGDNSVSVFELIREESTETDMRLTEIRESATRARASLDLRNQELEAANNELRLRQNEQSAAQNALNRATEAEDAAFIEENMILNRLREITTNATLRSEENLNRTRDALILAEGNHNITTRILIESETNFNNTLAVLTEAQNNLSISDDNLIRLAADLIQTQIRISDAQANLTRIETELTIAQDNNDEAQRRLALVLVDFNHAEQALISAQNVFAAANSSLGIAQEQQRTAQRGLDDANSAAAMARLALMSAQESAALAQMRLDTAQETNRTFYRLLNVAQADQTNAELRLASAQSDFANAQTELNEAQNAKAAAQIILNSAMAARDLAQTDLSVDPTSVPNLEIENARMNLEMAEMTHRQAQQAKDTVDMEVTRAEDLRIRAQNMLNTAMIQARMLRNRQESAHRELRLAEDMLDEARSASDKAAMKLQDAQDEVDRLRMTIADAHQEIMRFELPIIQLRKYIARERMGEVISLLP